MKILKIIGALMLFFAILFVGSAGIYHFSGQKGYSMNDRDAIVREISRHLKDPSSAIVNKLLIVPTSFGTADVCGSINGRNSYGAYAGDRLFSGTYNFETERMSSVEIAEDKVSSALAISRCSELLERHEQATHTSSRNHR